MVEKTVIEHLENIESKLDFEQIETLDEKLGCSFNDVVNNSKVYFEARDLVLFKRDKKNENIQNYVFGSVLFLFIVAYFVIHFCFNLFSNNPLNYLPLVFTLIYVLGCIIRILTRKPKHPARGFWNYTNVRFYVFENKIRTDSVKAPFHIMMIVFKTILILFAVVAFGFSFKELDNFYETYDFFLRIANVSVCEIALISSSYSFTTYDNDLLFETDDFVIRKSGSNYTREDK